MTSRAVLRFQGSLEQGFRVTLNIRDRQGAEVTEIIGALPGAPELITQLEDWQQQYRQGIGTSRIALESIKVKAGSFAQLEACRVAGRQLQRRLVAWLESPEFNPIDRRLREMLDPREAAELLVRTEDQRLHRLPWHCWDFIERYPRTEVIFGSVPERLPIHFSSSTKVRVLSILGDRRHINTDVDRKILEQLPQAEVTFLVEPSRQEVDRCLWEESWDVLFFAGHSHSQDRQGYLNLNAEESLTIEELRYGLKRAIAQGLQLSIFNSCDGLGLAYELEQLHIPQLMVMREPIPDAVAQAFLKYFLQSYARGESLHLALREARERLQSLEKEFPWATWLPVLFQNPAMNAPTWQQLQAVLPRGSLAESAMETAAVTEVQPTAPSSVMQPSAGPSSVMQPPAAQPIASSPARAAQLGTAGRSRKFWQSLGLRLGLGLTVSLSIVGLRYGGLLQSAELAVFDHFLRGRASEPEDDRILVVEVTDADIQAQDVADPLGRSLSDQTLLKLLMTLDSYGPKAIGLDLYRHEPTNLQPLAQQYAQNERLIGVCKNQDSEKDVPGIAPPPGIPPLRQGFSDVPLGLDGISRIQLLSATPPANSPCDTDFSLSAALAYEYLSAKGLELSFSRQPTFSKNSNPVPDTWHWGYTKLTHIGAALFTSSQTFAHYGPYANLNVSGHQLLLNYRVHQKDRDQPKDPTLAFPRLTVDEVLTGQLNKSAVQDKVILIGVTASSSDDRWQTPFRTREGESWEIPGVYLQAQMTSQILSAVEQQRLILRCLPWVVDGLMVVLLGLAVALLMPGRRKVAAVIVLAGCACLFYTVSLGMFVFVGIYLPLVPSLLALLGSGLGSVVLHQARSNRQQIVRQQLI